MLISNLRNKYEFAIVDTYPYKKVNEVTEWHKREFHCRPTYGRGFGKMKPIDKKIHNIEIRYPRYAPQITFEQYLAKQS